MAMAISSLDLVILYYILPPDVTRLLLHDANTVILIQNAVIYLIIRDVSHTIHQVVCISVSSLQVQSLPVHYVYRGLLKQRFTAPATRKPIYILHPPMKHYASWPAIYPNCQGQFTYIVHLIIFDNIKSLMETTTYCIWCNRMQNKSLLVFWFFITIYTITMHCGSAWTSWYLRGFFDTYEQEQKTNSPCPFIVSCW